MGLDELNTGSEAGSKQQQQQNNSSTSHGEETPFGSCLEGTRRRTLKYVAPSSHATTPNIRVTVQAACACVCVCGDWLTMNPDQCLKTCVCVLFVASLVLRSIAGLGSSLYLERTEEDPEDDAEQHQRLLPHKTWRDDSCGVNKAPYIYIIKNISFSLVDVRDKYFMVLLKKRAVSHNNTD